MNRQTYHFGIKMTCNRIIKPDFTKKQIAECGKCKHASARVLWCGLFGVHIQEHGKIIVPKKTMAKNFIKAGAKHVASGFKTRTNAEQEKIIAICKTCDEFIEKTKVGPRCKVCGCCIGIKKRWATSICPKGKW